MQYDETGPRWYEGLSARHWMVLAVASAGWVFDVYEGQLFTIFKTPMLKELTGGDPAAIDWQANLGLAAFLLGGAAGGLFFGVLGDRFGRVRIMAYTILVYSVFSALTAFATSALQVLVLRFLVAVGAGGEWAIAAALVAETFPARSRAAASGIFHASSVLGARTRIADRHGLRRARRVALGVPRGFGAGAPGPLDSAGHSRARALGGGAKVGGPSRRRRSAIADACAGRILSKPGAAALGNLRELFGTQPWRSRALLGLALATVGLATYWGIFAWSPELVGLIVGNGASQARAPANGKPGLSPHELYRRTARPALFRPAGLMARPAFRVRRLSCRGRDRAHRRRSWARALTPRRSGSCPLMAFFVLGMHAGYAIYFPELFPTRLRATGSSVCFNLGRVLGAAILIVRGTLGSALGLRWAVVAMSGLFWVGLVILIFAPETRGQELPE